MCVHYLFFKSKKPFLFALVIFSLCGCGKEKEITPAPVIDTVSKPQPVIIPAAKPVISIRYHLLCMDSAAIAALDSASRGNIKIILALNRIDEKYLLRQDTLVMPDTFLHELKLYSPFPDSIPALQEIDKIIFFSYYAQAFAAYGNGLLIRWGPVNMGKRSTPTPRGLFHTNWKAKQTKSTVNEEWIMDWYFNIENRRGISMHEYDLPGYPVSHSCIRMNEEDAYFIYHWADQWILEDTSKIAAYGTPLVIFGEYPFGNRKPWFMLTDESKALTISADSLTATVKEFLPLILGRQAKRDSVLSGIPL